MNFLISCFLFLGICKCQQEDYASASQIFNSIQHSIPKSSYNEFYFYKTIAEHQTLQQKEALQSLTLLENSFEQLPRRYQVMMFLIRMDLENWTEGDLAEITRQMNEVRSRLNNNQIDNLTQRKQADIIKNLDKLIKENEDAAKSASEKEDEQNAKKKGKAKDNLTPNSPLLTDGIMGGTGEGKIDNKKLRHIAENWGAMPPAERQRVTQEVSQNLPAKYKPFIDEYFKSLNRMYKP